MINKNELTQIAKELEQAAEMTSKIRENQDSVNLFREKWMEGIKKWGGAFQTFDKLFNMKVPEIREKGPAAADLIEDAWAFGAEFIKMQPDMVSLSKAFTAYSKRVKSFTSSRKRVKDMTKKQKQLFLAHCKKNNSISMVALLGIVEQSDKLLLHCFGLDIQFESLDRRIKTIRPVLN